MMRQERVRVGDLTLAVTRAGDGPTVVCCHGFPDLAYTWRRLLPVLAAAGFHAVAPDQRGYGATGGPDDVAAYDIHHLTGDLVGLLDALGVERAVFLGHDWGGTVAWMTALLHPERTVGVIAVNTPYYPRPSTAPIARLRAMHGDTHYMVAAQRPGELDAALARAVRRTLAQLFRTGVPPEVAARATTDAAGRPRTLADIVAGPDMPGDPVLSDDDLAVYVEAFSRTGFTGGINWYRNLDRNWATTPQLAGAVVRQPALLVLAEWDHFLPPSAAERMRGLVPDLEAVVLPRCGHWTPHERPDELAGLAVGWLRRHAGR